MLAPRLKEAPEILIITFAIVGAGVGLSEMPHGSLILSNLIIGVVNYHSAKPACDSCNTRHLVQVLALFGSVFVGGGVVLWPNGR
jgi:hypothetical protein